MGPCRMSAIDLPTPASLLFRQCTRTSCMDSLIVAARELLCRTLELVGCACRTRARRKDGPMHVPFPRLCVVLAQAHHCAWHSVSSKSVENSGSSIGRLWSPQAPPASH